MSAPKTISIGQTGAAYPQEIGASPLGETYPRFGERRVAYINGLGVWTLYKKEVLRFLKVATQTIAAPVSTAILFMAVFTLALGADRPAVDGIAFGDFIAPGLVMMAVMQNAFANTSSSIMIAKVQGNLVDVLMPPLSAGELTLAFAMGGMTRGIVVAAATLAVLAPFSHMPMHDVGAILFFAAGASLMMALLGILAGIWAEKFDHMAAVTNFIVMPLSFLSGTFYSVDRLPNGWREAAHFNPFFYLIDGFRFGVLGHADSAPLSGALVTMALCAALWVACQRAFRTGWKLKS